MVNYKLSFHPRFVSDVEEAIAYYNAHSGKAATKFKSATKKQLRLIGKNPLVKAIRYDDIRLACIEKFPYSIHYLADPSKQTVIVLRLLSDYRNTNADSSING